jgi:hypothetical protein
MTPFWVPWEARSGAGWGPAGAGPEAGSGSRSQLRSVRFGSGTSVLGQKPTFSALSAAEMRFFKTHGFVKPLLREMLFRIGFVLCLSASKSPGGD